MTRKRGFTLLEILLVVAAIAILAGIVIVAINPARQLADTRDAERHSDVEAISSAIAQFELKTGNTPSLQAGTACIAGFTDSRYGICAVGTVCGGVELSALVPDYIASIPVDPTIDPSRVGNYTGYEVMILPSDRILVCGPLTEGTSTPISVTR